MLGRRDSLSRVGEFEARHISETAAQLRSRSTAVAERLDAGTLAIAGVTYQLADGCVTLRDCLGYIGEDPDVGALEFCDVGEAATADGG